MIPGDRLLCAFTESLHVGDTFAHWPLHITIIPWFRTDMSSDDFGRSLVQHLGPLEPFRVYVDGEAHMGHHKIVNLLQTPTPLEAIQKQARQLLREHDAWMVDETTKRKREFKPHITVQKDNRVHEGDSFTCDSLYIIEQKGDYKEIVSRVEL